MDLLSHWTHLVSNIAGMFEHNQIQDPGVQRGLRTDAVVKLWAFAIRDQNRDGFIEERPEGHLDVGNDELNEMIRECSGILNFTLFLNMFGEKLKGTDPEEAILNAFKVFDPEGTVVLRGEEIKYHLVSQADKFTEDEVNHMFTNFPLKVAGNFDYKNACYVITHGEDKEQE